MRPGGSYEAETSRKQGETSARVKVTALPPLRANPHFLPLPCKASLPLANEHADGYMQVFAHIAEISPSVVHFISLWKTLGRCVNID
jgi:hypothetical protein